MSTVAEQKETTTNASTAQPQPASRYVSPDVNIFETAEGYVLEAELPGVSKSGVEISVEGNELTLVGRREKSDLKANHIYSESSAADYRRVFELDPAIDTAKVDAKIEQGILTVTLPKSERVKPRKVPVNG
jgi:HSP20 family protein